MSTNGQAYFMTLLGYNETKGLMQVRIETAPYKSWLGKEIILKTKLPESRHIARSKLDDNKRFKYSPTGLANYLAVAHPRGAMAARERVDGKKLEEAVLSFESKDAEDETGINLKVKAEKDE